MGAIIMKGWTNGAKLTHILIHSTVCEQHPKVHYTTSSQLYRRTLLRMDLSFHIAYRLVSSNKAKVYVPLLLKLICFTYS